MKGIPQRSPDYVETSGLHCIGSSGAVLWRPFVVPLALSTIQPSCRIFNLFFLKITSKWSSIGHKRSRMVSQIALTSKSKLTWVMPPHFSAVTVTACLAFSAAFEAHDARGCQTLLFTSLWSTVEEFVCVLRVLVCICAHCRCVWVAVCVEWASLFFFHEHSSNIERQSCVCVSVS